MTARPEFSRLQRLDQIGAGQSSVTVEAGADERRALAMRFSLIAIDALSGDFTLSRAADIVTATGRVRGHVVQACVATGDPVKAKIDEPVDIRFSPEPGDVPDEVELDADEADVVFYTGNAIDLGEAAAETLALALDPFPRSPAAQSALREAGVVSEDDVDAVAGNKPNPFGALSGLRDKLADKE